MWQVADGTHKKIWTPRDSGLTLPLPIAMGIPWECGSVQTVPFLPQELWKAEALQGSYC